MNDDYLWDKSGEPDPQVQRLEEILGTLRYQPKPFEIPDEVPAPRRRNYFPLIAIAATLFVALLAGGIWLRVRSRGESQPQYAEVPAPPAKGEPIAREPERKETVPEKRKTVVAVNKNRRKRSSSSALAKREREEALAVKQQLMFALRFASEKLNLAHKKTQNQVRNQHRAG